MIRLQENNRKSDKNTLICYVQNITQLSKTQKVSSNKLVY